MVRVSTCAVRNNMPKVKGKHLIFKTSIAGVKTRLLVDNRSEAELIDESFMRANKIPFFKLEELIEFILGNGKVVQKLTKRALVDVIIENHMEQLVCYLAKLDVYTIILSDKWLQMHNPVINWKKQTIKFNSANCIEKGCLSCGVLCIKFAVGSKLKNGIRSEKSAAVDPEIDIQLVNAKHFFHMARKKKHKSFLWILHVSTSNCNCCKTNGSSTQK